MDRGDAACRLNTLVAAIGYQPRQGLQIGNRRRRRTGIARLVGAASARARSQEKRRWDDQRCGTHRSRHSVHRPFLAPDLCTRLLACGSRPNRLALYATRARGTSVGRGAATTRMAVYTDVPDDELRTFLAEYALGEPISCKGIAEGVENSNYLLRTERGTFILTLYEKRVAPADLPFFLALMDHLAKKGIACPTPIHGRDGKALRLLCGRPAAIVSFLDGMWPRRILPVHCAGLGGALAQLHLAVADFPGRRANDLSLDGWRKLYEACRVRADTIEPGLAAELEAELGAL